jgi:hypothetical protein
MNSRLLPHEGLRVNNKHQCDNTSKKSRTPGRNECNISCRSLCGNEEENF